MTVGWWAGQRGEGCTANKKERKKKINPHAGG